MNKISEKSLQIISQMQQNEIDEYHIYKKIAKNLKKDKENAATLNRIADEEFKHYLAWRSYTHQTKKPRLLKVLWYTIIAKILGFTFAVKLMERGEMRAQYIYKALIYEVPESITIYREEKRHEAALLSILNENRLQYIGSMVLGMNDALVELTGSLAGFAFALQNSRLVALSGLIIGISATLSMAASEFLSARSEGRTDAFKSCCYTGIAYLVTVILLITPYLVFDNYFLALGIMIGIVLAEIAAFSYYIAIAKDEKFLPKFAELGIISFAAMVVALLVSTFAKRVLNLDI